MTTHYQKIIKKHCRRSCHSIDGRLLNGIRKWPHRMVRSKAYPGIRNIAIQVVRVHDLGGITCRIMTTNAIIPDCLFAPVVYGGHIVAFASDDIGPVEPEEARPRVKS